MPNGYAEIGTVETNEMMVIEKYSHVMHIVSNVRGELRDELGTVFGVVHGEAGLYL